MNDSFWTAVLAVGIVQGVFLVGALLLQRNANRRATRTLALIVAVLTLILLGEALGELLAPPLALLVICLNLHTELALGPLALLFVRSILEPGRPRRSRDALHFLPLSLGLIAALVAWFELRDRPAPLEDPRWLSVVTGYVLFKAAFLFTYVVATFRTLARGSDASHRLVAGRRPAGLRWLLGWLVAICAVPGAIYLTVLLEGFGVSTRIGPDQLGSFLLTAIIYLASLMVLLRPWVLSLTPRPRQPNRWSEATARLTSYLERERPWLDSELALGDLARALGSTENRLSELINEGLGSTFYGLLTRYRLAEFERLLRDPSLRDRPVLDLAFDAGFNSKASFYRAFRDAHGTTPTRYREAL